MNIHMMLATKMRTKLRQEQIATAALALMARQGCKALNIAALAQAVGVVPSAIYRHYSGKEAVLHAVLDLVSEKLKVNIHEVRQHSTDPLDQLRRLLDRHVQLIRDNVAIPRIILSEDVFSGHVKRRQHVHRIIQDFLNQVAELVREGQTGGRLRPDLPPPTVAVMFLGLIHPAVILWLASDGTFDIAAHAESAWPIFSHAIQAGGAAKAPASTLAVIHGQQRKEKQK